TIGPESIDLGGSTGERHTLRFDLSGSLAGATQRLLAPGGLPLSAFSPVLGDGVSTATAKGSGGAIIGGTGNTSKVEANPVITAHISAAALTARGNVFVSTTSTTST